MASTLEMVDNKTGQLAAKDVVDAQITNIASQLYTMKVLIPKEREHEAALFENLRRDLFELRGYINNHFEYKPYTK